MEGPQAEITGVPTGGSLAAVVIGASTGGPAAIEHVLRELPWDFPAPVAVCVHMPPGFTAFFAERLDRICRLRVFEARHMEPFEAGRVYVAPVGTHMRLRRSGERVTVRLDRDFADHLHVPSIDILIGSAAEAYGSRLLAVLLTGIGSDGALGMLAARRAGAYTLAESKSSAVAYGMPGSAVELGAVAEEVDIAEMNRVVRERVAGVPAGRV